MAKRPCATPGCATLGVTTYCVECARQKDRARGTRQQRGYDAQHDARRLETAARIRLGQRVTCTNPDCHHPDQPITLTAADLLKSSRVHRDVGDGATPQ